MNRRRVFRIAAVIVLIPVVAAGGWLLAASAMYTPEYVARVIAWGESDVGDYLTNFPQRRLTTSPEPSQASRRTFRRRSRRWQSCRTCP